MDQDKKPPGIRIDAVPTGTYHAVTTGTWSSSTTLVNDIKKVRAGHYEFVQRAISPEVDAAFDALHQQAVTTGVDYDAFERAIESLVISSPSDEVMDRFFQNATGIWQMLYTEGKLGAAREMWSKILGVVEHLEHKHGVQVHKGAGYYYWAENSLRAGNLGDGMTALHNAVAEDQRRSGQIWPNTPAVALATLDTSMFAQHRPEWVDNSLHEYVSDQLKAAGSNHSVHDLRQRLLLCTSKENTILFALGLTELKQIEDRTRPTSPAPTDVELQLIAAPLFRLAVVFENACKARSTVPKRVMAGQVVAISGKLAGQLTVGKGSWIEFIAAEMKRAPDLTLRAILDRTFSHSGNTLNASDTALAIVYAVRNLVGHDSKMPLALADRRADLVQQILLAFDYCIAAYY